MQIEKIMRAIGTATRMILESGGETYRAEETALHMARGFGIQDVEVFAMPTGIMLTLNQGEDSMTRIIRIHKGETNLTRLDECNRISRQVAEGKLTPEETIGRLQRIADDQGYAPWLMVAAFAVSCGFFCVMFNGRVPDLLVACFIGFVSRLVMNLLTAHQVPGMLSGMMLGFLMTLISQLFGTLIPHLNTEAIVSGALMPLLPGLAMTAAIRDTIRGDLVSGGAKVTEAGMTAVMLAAGAAVMLAISPLPQIHEVFEPLCVPVKLTATFIATASFGVLMNIRWKNILFGAVLGTVGYGMYLLFDETVGAFFIAAMFMAILSEGTARLMKCTATILITPSIIPLVPGLGLYRTMLYLVQSNYRACAQTGIYTCLGILCIALALTISAVLFVNISRHSAGTKRK